MREIVIPINGESKTISSEQNFVIVGANGSGKSHLGAWIERQETNGSVLRISAQRALSIPENITIKSEESAWNKMYYGTEEHQDKGYKWNWGQESTTKLINDYDSVLSAIFARKNKENDLYVKDCKAKEISGDAKAKVPMMITDKITLIWDSIFPQRKIIFEDAKVRARLVDKIEYHAKNMSDGERVAIYLIGQCLISPENTVIVIDEPEIHLHKSIMYKLWDKIEEFCPTKTFIYITHDLDFAASRKEATKIWIKSYDGKDAWELNIIFPDEEIPDSLIFEVLGNRKPILFVEGERGSYDNQLYPYIYEDYSIIPCHDCSKVIEMTKAFNNPRIRTLHHFDIKGLIDHDYMTEEEVESYKESKIYTLAVAEVENLYLSEDIVKIVAINQALNPDEAFIKVKDFLFDAFQAEYDLQLAAMCAKEIRHKLQCYTKPQENSLEALKHQMELLKNSINVELIYQNRKHEIDQIIESKDYAGLLRIYNRKSLHERVSPILKLSAKEYPNLILRLLKTDKKNAIVRALKNYTPDINIA